MSQQLRRRDNVFPHHEIAISAPPRVLVSAVTLAAPSVTVRRKEKEQEVANKKKEKEYVVEAVRVRSVLDLAVTALQKRRTVPNKINVLQERKTDLFFSTRPRRKRDQRTEGSNRTFSHLDNATSANGPDISGKEPPKAQKQSERI